MQKTNRLDRKRKFLTPAFRPRARGLAHAGGRGGVDRRIDAVAVTAQRRPDRCWMCKTTRRRPV
jgi:hypothetical protein